MAGFVGHDMSWIYPFFTLHKTKSFVNNGWRASLCNAVCPSPQPQYCSGGSLVPTPLTVGTLPMARDSAQWCTLYMDAFSGRQVDVKFYPALGSSLKSTESLKWWQFVFISLTWSLAWMSFSLTNWWLIDWFIHWTDLSEWLIHLLIGVIHWSLCACINGIHLMLVPGAIQQLPAVNLNNGWDGGLGLGVRN